MLNVTQKWVRVEWNWQFDLLEAFIYIESMDATLKWLSVFLHTCATCPELPSTKSTMIITHRGIFHGQTRGIDRNEFLELFSLSFIKKNEFFRYQCTYHRWYSRIRYARVEWYWYFDLFKAFVYSDGIFVHTNRFANLKFIPTYIFFHTWEMCCNLPSDIVKYHGFKSIHISPTNIIWRQIRKNQEKWGQILSGPDYRLKWIGNLFGIIKKKSTFILKALFIHVKIRIC